MRKAMKYLLTAGAGTAAVYGMMKAVAKRLAEDEAIDDDNPYLTGELAMGEKSGKQIRQAGTYESKIKPMLDQFLSFGGLIVLAPLYGAIALAIKIDDPGPVFFTQKRVGKDKKFFYCHKFRTMKMCTPHDMPTHQLSDPDQYITRVGRILRRTSLDELPQAWDIFRHKMSIIGPRPALWNQDDLVAERDKYGANDLLPGLTGWAQINGRDELEIVEKARLDGEYTKNLKQGGWKALFFDVKCFAGTILSVIGSEGVVEGGTGEMKRAKEKKCKFEKGENLDGLCGQSDTENSKWEKVGTVTAKEAGFADYGHLKRFDIDLSEQNKKRVLITGADSYIGESFEKWAKKHYPANFTIDTLDMQDSDWREKDFSPYDAVFHVAGIAHADVGKVSGKEKKKYYDVNTDLAIETAEKAKREGVRQFVLMSSMIIYGDSAPFGRECMIDEHTLPAPANFYGDSKWQADKGVRKLADGAFHVAVLRPPMIYGKGSRGNYRTLVKFAKKLPVFPDVENQRSMLYIGNLCEFLCKLMLSGEGGVYFPQNGEYTKTSEMVKEIAEAAGKRIWVTKLLNPAVVVGSLVPGKIGGLVNKAFGNSVYDQKLSRYEGLDYRIFSLKESIRKTEGIQRTKRGRKATENPLVSIITTTYNSEKTLAQTIESVLNQTYDSIEYIIIDGMSKDKTLQIAKAYRERFEQKGILYTIISEKDNGMYDAMNKGIGLAHGEIIGNINSDDWYEPDAVEKTVAFFEKTGCDFMYADLRMVGKDGRSYIKRSRKGWIETSRNWNHPTQLAKKSVYEQEKYKCESIHDDFDLFLRVKAKNYKIGIMNEVTANFRMGGVSHKRNVRDAIARGKMRYRIYRNNGYGKFYLLECFCAEALKLVLG